MTLTLEIAPEVESALAARAAQLGLPLERYAADELQRVAQQTEAAISDARGSHSRGLWAKLPGSVDEFLRERRECDGL